jgi:hypothetical protein
MTTPIYAKLVQELGEPIYGRTVEAPTKPAEPTAKPKRLVRPKRPVKTAGAK